MTDDVRASDGHGSSVPAPDLPSEMVAQLPDPDDRAVIEADLAALPPLD